MTSDKRNIEVSKILNVLDTEVSPGNAVLYTTSKEGDGGKNSKDARYILIQCASNIEDYSTLLEVEIPLMLGDINLDNQIDNVDRKLLADYLYYPESDERRPIFTAKQKAAADLNNDGQITQEDLEILVQFLNGEIPSPGVITYKYYVPREIDQLNNVASLLVMEGNVIEEPVPSGESKKCEIGIFHPSQIQTLYSNDETYEDPANIEINIEFEVENEDDYDRIDYGFNFQEVQGDTSITLFDDTGKITPYKPATATSIQDLLITINGGAPEDRDLSDYKLSRINNVYDRLYQQQGKMYYEKKIVELFSQELSWSRRTTTSGFSYLRSNMVGLKGVLLSEVPNLFATKFEVVSANDILNEVFTNQYEIAIDEQGRLLVYSSEINSLPLEIDMLAWLTNNKFYIYGELQTPTTTEVANKIVDLPLHKGLNKVEIVGQHHSPKIVKLQTTVKGIIESYIEEKVSSFPVMQSPIGLNFSTFSNDPWVVHHKILPYLLLECITPYSRSEEITYAQDMISEIYPEYKGSFIPGEYSDLLRSLVEKFQRTYIHYDKGDLNIDGKVDQVDIKLVEDYLNGTGSLSENQLQVADTNADSHVTIEDVNNMYKEYRGINDYIKIFDIQFLMGYIDPQTEYRMQKIINKKNGSLTREVGWSKTRPR